jgi:hypothetical protein
MLVLGVNLVSATSGFFSFLVPSGGFDFKTHKFVKTNLDRFKALLESDWLKKKKKAKDSTKKASFFCRLRLL